MRCGGLDEVVWMAAQDSNVNKLLYFQTYVCSRSVIYQQCSWWMVIVTDKIAIVLHKK